MIDWKKQWALHAPNFLNGYSHVYLQDYGKEALSFKLAPGGGFGDLSHPTTQIMLHLMPQKIDASVIDIGCGSGVLSLAAKRLGAPEVFGIDISDEAIVHAKHNSALNALDCFFGKSLPTMPKHPLILMNMISSEQRCAWEILPPYPGSTLIVSGFPIEEAVPSHYGRILSTLEIQGWKGFTIKMN